MVFFCVASLYNIITKSESLGGGDIKFIAGIGAFVGFYGIIFTILFSSIIAIIILLIVKYDIKKEFQFGPFLVFGSFIYIIFGEYIINLYLSFI